MPLPVDPLHRSRPELDAGLASVQQSPATVGRVEMLVVRPSVGRRTSVDEAMCDVVEGVLGDGWISRPSHRTRDGSRHPDMQVTLMNARAVALIAGTRERWALAGDQLYVDFDLSEGNLPASSRVRVGDAVLEITGEPHTGCRKFSQRFGTAATAFVNTKAGRALRLRGANARVVTPGRLRVGDRIERL